MKKKSSSFIFDIILDHIDKNKHNLIYRVLKCFYLLLYIAIFIIIGVACDMLLINIVYLYPPLDTEYIVLITSFVLFLNLYILLIIKRDIKQLLIIIRTFKKTDNN
uniref:Uncharacterized protein n=1 Tax=Staphylococcus aureus TaxID=1280 RepID=A0A6F8P0R0_STAAU|nr:hypothetical protein [Staphylococcus aureus]